MAMTGRGRRRPARLGPGDAVPGQPLCGPGLNDVYGIDINQLETESLDSVLLTMAEALNNSAIDVA